MIILFSQLAMLLLHVNLSPDANSQLGYLGAKLLKKHAIAYKDFPL